MAWYGILQFNNCSNRILRFISCKEFSKYLELENYTLVSSNLKRNVPGKCDTT